MKKWTRYNLEDMQKKLERSATLLLKYQLNKIDDAGRDRNTQDLRLEMIKYQNLRLFCSEILEASRLRDYDSEASNLFNDYLRKLSTRTTGVRENVRRY